MSIPLNIIYKLEIPKITDQSSDVPSLCCKSNDLVSSYTPRSCKVLKVTFPNQTTGCYISFLGSPWQNTADCVTKIYLYIHNKNIFSLSSGGCKLCSRCWHGWFSPGPLFLAWGRLPSGCLFIWSSVCVHTPLRSPCLISSSFKESSQSWSGPTLKITY